MFWTLNDLLGKALLIVVLATTAVCMLSPFWEFGVAWRQGQQDVDQYNRWAEKQRPVGVLNGKIYYSQEEFEADCEELHLDHLEEWVEQNERMLQDVRDRCSDLGYGR